MSRPTEAEHVEFRRPPVEQENDGLEGREAALTHVLAEFADVVEGTDRRKAHLLGVVQPVGATVRPVQAEPIADGSAKHFAYRHTEGFCLHVNERVLDRRDRLLDKAARRLTRARIEVAYSSTGRGSWPINTSVSFKMTAVSPLEP